MKVMRSGNERIVDIQDDDGHIASVRVSHIPELIKKLALYLELIVSDVQGGI